VNRASRRGFKVPPRRSHGSASFGLVVAILVVLILASLTYLGLQLYYRVIGPIRQAAQRVIATPVPVTGTPEPTPVISAEPINILLLGVDRRQGEESARNDVNIVVHVDPVHRFASMLSIPRDTQVIIPDHGADKINAAYSYGEMQHRDTGGGPVLSMKTMEGFLGIEIDYYAQVDFRGFERIVDLLGGITVDVPWPLVDNEYPTDDYGYTRIYIPAGLQHMDGRTALQYVRSRHADSDLGRNQRQQDPLLALRERILRLELLADLDRLNQLLEQMGDTFKTDMSLATIYDLARLAPKIDRGGIASFALDWHCLTEISPTYELVPDMGCVEDLVQQMQMDPATRELRREGASIEVRNGTFVDGLGRNTAEYLGRQGFDVVNVIQDNDAGHYSYTLILDNRDLPFTRNLLVQRLHTQPAYAFVYPDYDFLGVEPSITGADIVIILGEDYRLPQE